ncbi:hypothetical protein ACLKMH_19735 [Psychromonas sp. KJ10-10]|uniref:hypothetical protein n=1 Tax=Psychromonas sp. KJ10-10 TaxID=3391823 RepID=UPI0039B64FA7
MKVFTIAFVFSVVTLFILMILDTGLSNLYCVWPLHIIEATGILGNNPEGFYNDWLQISMTFSLLVQTSIIYFLTSRLRK